MIQSYEFIALHVRREYTRLMGIGARALARERRLLHAATPGPPQR
jgi:hypothetical protein